MQSPEFLQAATTASTSWVEQLLSQGVVGLLALLCIFAVVALRREAATISKRVESVTDRFLGHLEAQSKRDAVEAEGRVAAQMKVAVTLESVERRLTDHDAEVRAHHREVMDKLRGP